jgi:hypothetical protein
MKTRYLFTLALAALLTYVLAAGCTQDFNVFQTCSTGQKLCDDGCVDMADPVFGCTVDACTPCDTPNATAGCTGAACVILECNGNFENCDGSAANGCEADTTSNPSHCGACGNGCITPHAEAACDQGDCVIGVCAAGFEDCDGMVATGCEADLQNDPLNCGSCAFACPQPLSCQAGQCVLECPDGMGDCDMDPSNGCETPLGSTTHCAFCGDACNLANATASCTAGACVVETCNAGFDDCNGMDADGCEANLLDSAMTCGTCANVCPAGQNGTTTCDNGQCAINCNAGFGDCDGDVANGCETDVNGSLANCGQCGQACAPPNGTGACNGGACQLSACTAPFDDCDNDPGNGCETNLNTSVGNCSTCGMACAFANAGAACNMGVCALGNCNTGFGNCDGMNANGCETATTNDPAHCGMCGFPCSSAPNAQAACVNSTCGLACDAGFSDCDGMAATGCEVDTAINVNHCGQCGRACSGSNVASKSCTNGLCDSTCALGSANCNLPVAPAADNGCELNVSQNNTNCGGCGVSCSQLGSPANSFECDQGGGFTQQFCGCSQNQECSDGAAGFCNNGLCLCNAITCHLGEACGNVGGVSTCTCNDGPACAASETCCPAGCANLDTSAQNCGACGHACTPGFVCFDPGAIQSPECRCDDAADCNAGTGGTFACNATGRCVCGATTCAIGQRCLPNGQCG